MSKQSNQRYRKEVMKNKQDNLKNSDGKSASQISDSKDKQNSAEHTENKEY